MALVTRTLRQAKQQEQITDGLLLHSDQGAQYTSQAYHDILTLEYNITPSMSRRGNCWDNAPMENFFGHLKEEYLRQFKHTTFKETEQRIDEYFYFYNYERLQLQDRHLETSVCPADQRGLLCLVDRVQSRKEGVFISNRKPILRSKGLIDGVKCLTYRRAQ
jgi:hypothetical protein